MAVDRQWRRTRAAEALPVDRQRPLRRKWIAARAHRGEGDARSADRESDGDRGSERGARTRERIGGARATVVAGVGKGDCDY